MIPLQIHERDSPNHGPRHNPARIDMLVLHYTGMRSAEAALERLCDPDAKVSAHYVVEEHGRIWRLVPETRRAFHAGRSCWEGESDLNTVSIGIEIVNPGHDWGYRAFPEAQMVAVERLSLELMSRHPIPPRRIVGHSDIAPDRKADPGELFDWPRLAAAGIGIWPPAKPPASEFAIDGAQWLVDLTAIGYCAKADSYEAALVAFQRRFRQASCDGRLDPETAWRLAEVRAAFAGSRGVSGERASHVEVQNSLQPLQVNRAVPHS
jgi:N-acetylmuramoyl-L-alanine amidase